MTPGRHTITARILLLILLLGVVAFLELLALEGLELFDARAGLTSLDRGEVARWQRWIRSDGSSGNTRFDVDLGWDSRTPVRAAGAPPPQGHLSAVSTYGDSFTYCDDVQDHQTWQYFLQQRLGRRVLNLGTPGAGTDQAFLKLKKYHRLYPAQVVILGIYSDTLRRSAGVVSSFYQKHHQFGVKPHFVPTEGGGFKLFNPLPAILRAEPSDRLWLQELAEQDFWYAQTRRQFGYDLLQGRGFPYLLELASLAVGLFRHGFEPLDQYNTFISQPESEPTRGLMHVLGLFQEMAREQGFFPMVMVHCDEGELSRPVIKTLEEHVRTATGLTVFSVCNALNKERARRNLDSRALYSRGRHYSQLANQILARRLEAAVSVKLKK